MKKIFRILGSRVFLAGLCVVIEAAQLVLGFMFMQRHFMPVTILGWVLQVVVLLYVVNRDEIPEFKVPWLLVLLLLPVTGAFIFLLFSTNDASKAQRRRHGASMEELLPYIDQTEGLEVLRETDAVAARQAAYLCRAAHVPCSAGTEIVYYPLGERFEPALLEALERAEKFIFMEYFIVEEGVMFDPVHDILRRKAAAGVEVWFMYDDFGCVASLPSKYYELLRGEGIHAIPANRLRPVFSRSYNNRDHRKITVVDGVVGFTGGLNLSDRYMNAEVVFGHWKDTAIRLTGPAVRSLTALFISSWNTQTDETIDPAPYMRAVPEERDAPGFAIPFGDGPPPLYRERIGKNVFLGIIYAATEYVYITTPYLICDHEILNALRIAAGRGVDVRIITPHIPDKKAIFLITRSNYLPLVSAGVRIYEYTPGFIHAKNFIADDVYGVCGSINLDYRSLVHNFECGVWMYGADCVRDMRADFLDTVAQSEEITVETARLRGVRRLLAEVLKLFSTLA